MLVSGSILFALADPITFDVFIPGLTLMAAAGPGVLFSHFHLVSQQAVVDELMSYACQPCMMSDVV